MNRSAAGFDRCYCLAEVDIFADLAPAEMDTLAAVARLRTYTAGELFYSPQNLVEALFILKKGRVRVFRVTADGRAFTTGIINPGTFFGEIVLLGQPTYDSYAEALDEAVVCMMSRNQVLHHLLSDPRIAARIAETLGRRLVEMERRLSDMVLKSVYQRVAATLATFAGDRLRRGVGAPGVHVALSHEQLAALVGTSRVTAAKVLGELADRGLIHLARGEVIVLDVVGIAAEAGDLSRLQQVLPGDGADVCRSGIRQDSSGGTGTWTIAPGVMYETEQVEFRRTGRKRFAEHLLRNGPRAAAEFEKAQELWAPRSATWLAEAHGTRPRSVLRHQRVVQRGQPWAAEPGRLHPARARNAPGRTCRGQVSLVMPTRRPAICHMTAGTSGPCGVQG